MNLAGLRARVARWVALSVALGGRLEFVSRSLASSFAATLLFCAAPAEAVVYSGLKTTPSAGVVAPNGTLQVKFDYSVSATNFPGLCGVSAVTLVELREVGVANALASDDYTPSHCSDNGVEWLDEPRTSSFTVPLGQGTHKLYLRTYLKANVAMNPVDSSALTVEVTLNTAPTVTLSSPANDTTYTLQAGKTTYPVPVTASGADSDGSVASMDLVVDAGAPQTFTGASISTTRNLAVGNHSITVTAKDNLGGTSSKTTQMTVARSSPYFNTQSQTSTGGVVLPGGTVTAGLQYSVDLNGACDAIKSVELWEVGVANALKTQPYNIQFTACQGAEPLDETRAGTLSSAFGVGTHKIFLRARSYFGTAADSNVFTVTVTNNVKPTATLTLPGDGDVYVLGLNQATYAVRVRGTASDSDGSVKTTDVVVDGVTKSTVQGGSVDLNLSLAAGAHTVNLVAWDDLAQSGSSSVADITIKPRNDSSFVSQVLPPTYMLAGATADVSVTMKNTGGNTWPANSTYKLGSQNPQNNTDWGFGRVVLKAGVAPGASTTIPFTVTAPSTPGSYNFQWRMLEEGAEWFGATSTNKVVNVVAAPELTVSRSPSPLIAGEAYKLTWTSKNATKVEFDCTASGTGYVAKGEMATTSGTSNGVANTAWTGYPSTCTWTATGPGGFTKVVTETMTTIAPTHSAQLVLVTVPGTMDTGKSYAAMVTMKNTGNGTWFAGSNFQLGSQKPADNKTWGLSRVNVDQDVSPGEEHTFAVPVTAPAAVGAYGFNWQMVRNGSVWFGPITDATVSVVVESNLAPVPVDPLVTTLLANANAGTLPGELGVSSAGAATYSIPIEVPPGTAGQKPSLSLNYSSQAGNGLLGLGWSLGGLSSIHRCGQTIAQDGVNGRIRFDGGDRLCLDGQRLVLVNKEMTDANYWADDAEYRTEIDSFSRITAQLTNGKRSFRVETKDHRVMVYGLSGSASNSYVKGWVRKINEGTPNEFPVAPTEWFVKTEALSWAIDTITDRAGNYVRFSYTQDSETGEHLPSFIRYGGVGLASHAAVQFVYEARPDAWKRYVDDARNDLRSRVSHLKTYFGDNLDGDVAASGTLVRDYVLAYDKSPSSGRSTLKSVQGCARNPQTAELQCLPATLFEWGVPDTSKTPGFVSRGTWAGAPSLTTTNVINGNDYSAVHEEYFAFADFENHGYTDVLEMRVASPVPLGWDTWDFFARNSWLVKDANSKAAGTLQSQYRYFHNTGTAFAQYQYKLSTGQQFVVLATGDFNGDGAPDLLAFTQAAGQYTGGAKICLSPLSKLGPQGAPGSTITFNCSNNLAATGENTNYGTPHVIDVVGDGRSSLYSRFDDQLRYAILCIQGQCVNDTAAPYTYLGYTYAVCCNPPSPLSTYVRFDEMVDFAGTGKQQDARWTAAHYVKTWCDDGGATCTYKNAWVNTQPIVRMTGFRQPDSADSAYAAGSLASYVYPGYTMPGCPNNGCAASLPPYDFHVGKNAVGDFNGSGYSGLLFGFIEYVLPAGGYRKSELTLCLSTGRRLDCGVRQKYSGAKYVAPGKLGNYVGDGVPRFLGRETQMVDGMMQYGARLACRITGDDTTGGAGTNDDNIVCEPWNWQDLPELGREVEMDVLGTGRPQSIVVTGSNWEVFEPVDLAKTNQALDRIYAVTNGLGGRSSVEYVDGVPSGTVTRSGTTTLGYPQHVTAGTGKIVKRLRKDNGAKPDLTTRYQYVDAGIDVAGRGSLGFAQVISTDEQSGIVTTTSYSQQWPFVGMVLSSVVTKPGSAQALSDTQNRLVKKTIAQTFGSTAWPFVAGSTTIRDDDGGEYMGKVSTSGVDGADVQYSVWGNLLKMKVVSEGSAVDSSATFTTTTVNTYFAADKDHWLVDLPSYQSVKKEQSGDPTAITRTKNITYEDGYTGRVKSEKIQDADDALRLTIEYDRTGNPFGLVKTKTERWQDPKTLASRFRDTTTVFDAKGRLPVTLTNPLGQSETRDYNYGSGAPTRRTDLNKLVTSWTVDGFGRVLTESRPDGTQTRSDIKRCTGDCPSDLAAAVAARITDQFYGSDRIAVPQLSYIDSAGRVLRTQTWGFAGKAIVADQRYDDRGRAWETDQAHYVGESAQLGNRQEYDDLNRVTQVTTLDEEGVEHSLTTDYQGMVTVITNAKGQKRTDRRDVLGQVREVLDAKNGLTKFGYDPFGNLTQTVDPNGNVITVKFDDIGHKTQLVDPDLGSITYLPDPLGRVREQVNPVQRDAGQSTVMDYDRLDRMFVRVEPELTSHWVYDTAANGVGQLAEAYTGPDTDKDYRRIHTYDSLGRPGTTTQVLTDASYTSTPSYDAWGRVMQQKYQRGSDAAKVFTLRYNSYGYQQTVERPGLVLWKATAQDAAQRVTQSMLGNGLTQSRVYNPNTGRLESAMLKTAADAVRLQEGYRYDELGNVEWRQQLWDTVGFEEDFSYDELNRLWTSTVGGQAAKTFTYDAAGNIKTKTGTGTYTYPPQGASAVRPHAVQSVSGLSGTFSYDLNGNLLGGAGRTATWTSFDMPITITKGTSSSTFVYGPEHQRAKQTRLDGTVIIYAGAQEVETKAGVTTIKTYWPGGVGLEIDKTGQSATQLMWTHADRLGSPVAITDAAGNLAEKLAYDAWGKRRTTTGVSTPDSLDGVVDNKGFTHHEMLDQLDLVHMNGRVYDPFTGRFLSGDPLIQDPVNGQNYNRYSYVLNNPTNLTDPTGFAAACDPSVPHVCEGMAHREETKNRKEEKENAGELRRLQNRSDASGNRAPSAKGSAAAPPVTGGTVAVQGVGAANGEAAGGSSRDDAVRSAWAASPNRFVAEAAPCVGHEGACAAAAVAPLGGGWLSGTALGRYMLAAFGLASAPNSDVPLPLSGGVAATEANVAAKGARELAKAEVFAARTAPELKKIYGWGNGEAGVKAAREALDASAMARIQGSVTRAEVEATRNLYREAAAARRGGAVAPQRAAYMEEILKLWK
jgi:RHS repeat-associated protein